MIVTDQREEQLTVDNKSWKQYLAKVIRVISIPPVMVFTLLIILMIARDDFFLNAMEVGIAIICLAIVPVLAYPLQKIIPGLKEKGREGQRELAFALSAAGYLTACLYGVIAKSNPNLMLIFGTYMLSVIILIIFNKGLKLRASGHACSVSGPIIFLCYSLGLKAAFLCILLYGAILWASLELKRHTLKEFILGTASCMIAFLCNLLIF
jgi:hypothetical protein